MPSVAWNPSSVGPGPGDAEMLTNTLRYWAAGIKAAMSLAMPGSTLSLAERDAR